MILSTEVSSILAQQNAVAAMNANYAAYLSSLSGHGGPYVSAGNTQFADLYDPRAVAMRETLGITTPGDFRYGTAAGAPGAIYGELFGDVGGGIIQGASTAGGIFVGATTLAAGLGLLGKRLTILDPWTTVTRGMSEGMIAGLRAGGAGLGIPESGEMFRGLRGTLAAMRAGNYAAAARGITGALVGGAIRATPYMGIYYAATFGIDRMMEGARHQAAVNEIFQQLGTVQNLPLLGRHRWTYSELGDIGATLRDISHQDIHLPPGQLNQLVAGALQGGLLSTVRSAGELPTAIRELVNALRDTARTFNVTMNQAIPYLRTFQQMGFTQVSQAAAAAQFARAYGVPGAISPDAMMQAGLAGAQSVTAWGGGLEDARQAALASMGLVGRVGFMTRHNIGDLSQDMLFRLTGQTGEAGALSYANMMQAYASGFAQRWIGRIGAMGMMDPVTGRFSPARLGYLGSVGSMIEAARSSMRTRGSRVDWLLHGQEITQQAIAEMGPDVFLGTMLRAITGRLSARGIVDPDEQLLILQRRTGIPWRTAQAAMSAALFGPLSAAAQKQAADAELQYAAESVFAREVLTPGAAWEIVKREATGWATKPLREIGAYVTNAVNEQLVELASGIVGVRSVPINPLLAQMYQDYLSGHTRPFQRLLDIIGPVGDYDDIDEAFHGYGTKLARVLGHGIVGGSIGLGVGVGSARLGSLALGRTGAMLWNLGTKAAPEEVMFSIGFSRIGQPARIARAGYLGSMFRFSAGAASTTGAILGRTGTKVLGVAGFGAGIVLDVVLDRLQRERLANTLEFSTLPEWMFQIVRGDAGSLQRTPGTVPVRVRPSKEIAERLSSFNFVTAQEAFDPSIVYVSEEAISDAEKRIQNALADMPQEVMSELASATPLTKTDLYGLLNAALAAGRVGKQDRKPINTLNVERYIQRHFPEKVASKAIGYIKGAQHPAELLLRLGAMMQIIGGSTPLTPTRPTEGEIRKNLTDELKSLAPYFADPKSPAHSALLEIIIASSLDERIKAIRKLEQSADTRDEGVKQAIRHLYDTLGSGLNVTDVINGEVIGRVYVTQITAMRDAIKRQIAEYQNQWKGRKGSITNVPDQLKEAVDDLLDKQNYDGFLQKLTQSDPVDLLTFASQVKGVSNLPELFNAAAAVDELFHEYRGKKVVRRRGNVRDIIHAAFGEESGKAFDAVLNAAKLGLRQGKFKTRDEYYKFVRETAMNAIKGQVSEDERAEVEEHLQYLFDVETGKEKFNKEYDEWFEQRILRRVTTPKSPSEVTGVRGGLAGALQEWQSSLQTLATSTGRVLQELDQTQRNEPVQGGTGERPSM